MGLWSLLSGWRKLPREKPAAASRACRFETMEERRLLDADPIKIGVTYLEEDSGSDLHGDTFQVLFEGGAAGTELTRLVIDGDHGPAGLSFADMIFDTVKGGLGADEAFNLQVISSTGIQHVSWQVSDGGSKLTLLFSGFQAGEKLVFSIDVDEVQQFDPSQTNQQLINEGIDPIASGVEFQSSHLTADFHAPHYHDIGGTSEFRNLYDAQFSGAGLLVTQGNPSGLPNDDFNGKRDRSTGTMLQLQQLPLPVTIAGRVFADNNRNLVQDGSDFGMAGVSLALWKQVNGQWTNTGHTTTTNVQGDYSFGLNLNLQPGVYQVRETQPAGFFSVGAIPGTVGGAPTGATIAGDPDVLTEINLPLGDLHGIHYNFAEAQPASLSGRVHLTDRQGNCFSEEALNRPLAGVKITLKDAAGNVVATQLTNASGEYLFQNLLPGTYTIVEETPAGLLDGADHIGTIGGIKVGAKPANDTISQIILLGGQDGVNYDFCEHEPADVGGFVYHDANNNGVKDASETAIGGATVVLLDAGGTQVATTTTDSSGFYKFANLAAGTYSIREVQPSGWLDGQDAAGTIAGQIVGSAENPGDRINGVALLWGDSGVNYNFGELLPGSLSGRVWVDPNENDVFDAGDSPLAGVTIQLVNQSGQAVGTTTTDAQGQYEFTDLAPGVYAVRELQPGGYLQGGQRAGSGGGNDSATDLISQITVGSGDHFVNYDFWELQSVSIAGHVWADTIPNCIFDPSESAILGVTIQLLNSQGQLVATTQTLADGSYLFANLRPGTYSVRELQPAGYFDGEDMPGNLGGDASQNDLIASVVLKSGDVGVNYDFCETPPAKISGYVFRDGPPITSPTGEIPENLYELRDGLLTPDDLRLRGVVLELRYTLTGEPVRGEDLLPGKWLPGPVRVVTGADGYYEFDGLPQGNYSIFELHPSGFIDSRDTAGTTSGLAINVGTLVSPLVVQTFAAQGVSFKFDAIVQVPLAAGQHSQFNNFSEVQVKPVLILIPPPPPVEPPPEPPLFLQQQLLAPPPDIFIPPPVAAPIVTGGTGNFTWHLSIIDAGLPRIARRSTRHADLVFRPALWVERTEWLAENLRAGTWTIHTADDPLNTAMFGLPGATPVVGDFNGDGKDEIGVYYEGEWFLDLNGNGHWDPADLWAKLGSKADKPVIGDWDGDGKDDIGIYGPEWAGDPVQIEHEPGLPDQDNQRRREQKPKNVPPNPEEATDGERLLRLTAQGKERADLIDHVFAFGGRNDHPIAGDWNGDGIRSIGVFREGKWHFDMDGDGRWSDGDKLAKFGQKGDLPVVGDFNGDGIEEIAVFRGGRWIIDTNGNRQIDAADRTLDLGQEGDVPLAGDFNGDGIDEPAVYRPSK
ncbi:MAG TPA: SdrD B-like domain-containing protein [Pirellulaceae bacterium]|nr:SdrD B-like domain-containing protein [Pirellulaceae bacterium]